MNLSYSWRSICSPDLRFHFPSRSVCLGIFVLDLDGQASLTRALGLAEVVYAKDGDNIYTLLTTLEGDTHNLIRRTSHDVFDLLPGHYEMFEAAESVAARAKRTTWRWRSS